MKKITLVCALVLALALGTAGCGGVQNDQAGQAPNTAPLEKQVVKAALGYDDIDTLDPLFANTAQSMTICHTIFNKLVRYRPGTKDIENIEGDLAQSWELSDDELTLTFKLREGVKWHKGFGDVTSEDVKFSLERMITEPASSLAPYFNKVEMIETPDKHTVVVRFNQPDPFFLPLLCGTSAAIVPKAAVEKYGKDFRINPVGSGPYQFDTYYPKEKVFVAANESYFRGAPKVDKIEFLFILDRNALLNAFLSGTVDVADWKGDQQQFYDAVDKSKDGLIIDVFPGASFYILLDTVSSPTNDIRIRKALAHAIDAETYVRKIEPKAGAWYVPSFGFLPRGYLGYTEEGIASYEYSPEKAKELLAEAGYPDGLIIKGYCPQLPVYMLPFTYVQDQLAKVGIQYDLEMVDNPTYVEKLINGECRPLSWDIAYRGSDPYFRFVRLFATDRQAFIRTGYDKVEHLIRSVETEFDLEIRKQVYEEIQQIISKDVVAIPIQCALPIVARWPYIDLGYEAKENQVYYYEFDENLKMLK